MIDPPKVGRFETLSLRTEIFLKKHKNLLARDECNKEVGSRLHLSSCIILFTIFHSNL